MELSLTTKRERSPQFPYVGLDQSIEFAHLLYSKAKRSLIRLEDAAIIWNYSPSSSSVLRVVAALTTFGLAEDISENGERRVRITDLAVKILEDDRDGAKESAKREAAAKAAIIVEVFASWGNERPDDAIAISALKFDFGFGDTAAKRFLKVYDNTVPFLKDVEDLKRSKYIEEEHVEKIDPKQEENNVKPKGTVWFQALLPNGPAVSISSSEPLSARNVNSLVKLLNIMKDELLEEEAT